MMKLQNVLLACALGAGSLLTVVAPASAAPVGRVSGVTMRSVSTGRVLPGNRFYGTGYHYGYGYPYRYGYRYGYGYPYRYGPGYGVSVGFGVGVGYGAPGYGYVGGGYGYAPYPVAYGAPAYWVRHPYWHPYRRAYWGPRFVR